ncbi:MAG TPA: cytochrome c [Chloroflexota bacterium]|jgi:mono/diheme cytochrome c family protein
MAWRSGAYGVLALAVFVAATTLTHRPAAAAPISQAPADAASLARGQEIYGQMCAVCHGFQGRGDGPLARTMVPRPADFRVHMAEGHTPDQLFDWTSNGVPDTAMQGFANDLSVDDRWNVINYLQTFAPATQ